jgi:hypothetical protein
MNAHYAAQASEWPQHSLAFIDFWESLRDGDALVPTSEAFLDSSAASFMATVYMGEVTPAGVIVRFHGTELVRRFGRDLTGLEIHAGRGERMKRRSLANVKHMIERPCGLMSRWMYATEKDRLIFATTVILPLTPKPGRPPRIVCHSLADEVADYSVVKEGYFATDKTMWIDIGAGMPAEQPYPLSDGK